MAYFIGKGTTLTITMAGPLEVLIGQLVSYDGPDMSFGSVETTTIGSAQREFLSTIQDSGTGTFLINWDPTAAAAANHDDLLAQFKLGTNIAFKIKIPGAAAGTDEISFTAHLTGFSIQGVTVDGLWQVQCSFRTTLDVTMA